MSSEKTTIRIDSPLTEQESIGVRALIMERDALRAEVESLRVMFDVTRHRMALAMGAPIASSWSALESNARNACARVAELEGVTGRLCQILESALEAWEKPNA